MSNGKNPFKNARPFKDMMSETTKLLAEAWSRELIENLTAKEARTVVAAAGVNTFSRVCLDDDAMSVYDS